MSRLMTVSPATPPGHPDVHQTLHLITGAVLILAMFVLACWAINYVKRKK